VRWKKGGGKNEWRWKERVVGSQSMILIVSSTIVTNGGGEYVGWSTGYKIL